MVEKYIDLIVKEHKDIDQFDDILCATILNLISKHFVNIIFRMHFV